MCTSDKPSGASKGELILAAAVDGMGQPDVAGKDTVQAEKYSSGRGEGYKTRYKRLID